MPEMLTMGSRSVLLNEDGTWQDFAPTRTALEALRSVDQPAEVVEGFGNLFEVAGVRLLDTGEQLTCRHQGSRIDFEAGMDVESVDFVVETHAGQVERMVEDIATGQTDDLFWFRIARTLLTQSALGRRNVLNNPLMRNRLLRLFIRGRELCHVTLASPDPSVEPDSPLTLAYVNRRWMLLPGHHGDPERRMRVGAEDAMELQEQFFAGMRNSSPLDWLRIARWYLDWRRRVEVPV